MLGRFAGLFADFPIGFDLQVRDGSVKKFGTGDPRFHVTIRNADGERALTSADAGRIGDAYVNGDLDIDGDMLAPFALRAAMSDFHPLVSAWRFIQPMLFGQTATNARVISAHYDIDPAFFLSLLDPKVPCYTQGIFEHDDEPLKTAVLRKFEYCFDRLKLKPGDRILEVGPGWGAWFEFASRRGVHCTGITNSQVSADYLNARSTTLGFDWKLIVGDFLEFNPGGKFDAIVIMGVVEHLPQYAKLLARFEALLKPGHAIFLDGSAATKKYELSSFMVKYIYGGNHSFLILHDFLEKMAATPLRVTELFNDRHSYYLTFVHWARNFESHRDDVIARFGEFNYRRFRLYLWGAAYEFLSRSLDCYRMIIELPRDREP
jgi:cyclopropane-fatty-acyl-phospholipid synthase